MKIVNRNCLLVGLSILLMTAGAVAQNSVKLTSPDGNLVFNFRLSGGSPSYSVAFKGKLLVDQSSVQLEFKQGGIFGENLSMERPEIETVDENFELVVGKASLVRNHYREVGISLREKDSPGRQVVIRARVFNDGVAFRYEFPEQKNWSSYVLTEELTTWKLAGNPLVRTLFRDQFVNDHEGLYTTLPLADVKEDTLMDLPTLFEFPDNIYMAITEAALIDYAGMYLRKEDGVLKSTLSPLPGQAEEKVKAILPHRSPWRVMMISDRIGDLLESNIIASLNEPTSIKDLSWIQPGKTTFHWWNGDIVPDTTFAPGANFEFNKYYIDFCARNKIDFHAVIGYGGFSWYKSDSAGYGEVGPNTDASQPVASLDMKQICDYAREQGVGIHLWVNWKALYPRLDKAFAQYEEWGVRGLMVDFLNRDDQEMVNIQEEILKKAADHKLYIQFHGAYKPTGLHRTYPNEFTREGAYNYEQDKWNEKGVSPEHDLNIVFTRLLAGATDYHLGGFRAATKETFINRYTKPLVLGTRCHMLAMYVVLESYLASLCDYPEAYEEEPGFEFLIQVPTTWDETIVPDAAVDQYATMARRKGADWYIGSINNSEPRTIRVPLSFLPEGSYEATIYSDATDAAEHPNRLTKEIRSVSNKEVITIQMAPGGGQVMWIRKKTSS